MYAPNTVVGEELLGFKVKGLVPSDSINILHGYHEILKAIENELHNREAEKEATEL